MKRYYQSKKNTVLILLVFLLITSISYAQISLTHFTPVWQGENGQNHMNILVVSAILEDLPLAVNDEIAVFSGSACVGAAKLTKAINPADNSTFITIFASQDDGSNNGFLENDTIIFKIWDNKNQKEFLATSVTFRNDISTWLTSGKFSGGASSVVEISNNTQITQTIQFIKGNNLFSTYLIPENPDLSAVFKSFCDQGYLIKILDESGNSFAYSTKKNVWINSIGSIEKTEGYLISLNANCNLQIRGKMIDLPLDIPLHAGWNYISFPSTHTIGAMQIIQPLIDQKKLIKVQDEQGNSIETLKRSGVWINNIGNFYPGKAYKINVSSSAVLTIQ